MRSGDRYCSVAAGRSAGSGGRHLASGGAERTALSRRCHPRRRAQPGRGDGGQPAEHPARSEHGAAPARRRPAAGGEAALWSGVLLQPRSAPADRRYAVRRRGGRGHRVPGPGGSGADADRRLRGPSPRQQSARRTGARKRRSRLRRDRAGAHPLPDRSAARRRSVDAVLSGDPAGAGRSLGRFGARTRGAAARCRSTGGARRAAGGVRAIRGGPRDGTRRRLLSLSRGGVAGGRPCRRGAGRHRSVLGAESRRRPRPTR